MISFLVLLVLMLRFSLKRKSLWKFKIRSHLQLYLSLIMQSCFASVPCMNFPPFFHEEFVLLDKIPQFVVWFICTLIIFLAKIFLGDTLMFRLFFFFTYRYDWIQSKKQDRYSYVSSSLSPKAHGKNENN